MANKDLAILTKRLEVPFDVSIKLGDIGLNIENIKFLAKPASPGATESSYSSLEDTSPKKQ